MSERLQRAIITINMKSIPCCAKCEDQLNVGETVVLHNGRIYCECCVEDYEEEGRPL